MTSATAVLCASCGRRLAKDHAEAVCSPCRRTMIETSARHQVRIAGDREGIQLAFGSTGLYGVAHHLDCTPAEALDAVISARVIPFMSERRRAVLRRLVCMRGSSHVAVADALQISRWTVASYRQQLGIDRTAAAIHGAQR